MHTYSLIVEFKKIFMSKKPLILGIETSCDETAASIIQEDGDRGVPRILSNIVSSQFDVHKEFGGVVPDLAARAHVEKIDLIVKEAVTKSKKSLDEIDAIAATAGPGLMVCLSVGLNFAKALSLSINKPFIGVNHLEGHAISPKLHTKLNFPYLLLLISGGHSQYLSVNGLGDYKRLGTTIDDALGEAFDKTAKLLGLKFPGGSQIEILAKSGDPNRFKLPLPIINKGGCNLSFAGLKTAVLKISKGIKTENDKSDLAASFQATIKKILSKQTSIAFNEYLKINKSSERNFVVAGGVAANKYLRNEIENISYDNNFKVFFPSKELCGDNAAMIAMVGLEKFKKKNFSSIDLEPNPRWQLDEKAKFLKGSGIKL